MMAEKERRSRRGRRAPRGREKSGETHIMGLLGHGAAVLQRKNGLGNKPRGCCRDHQEKSRDKESERRAAAEYDRLSERVKARALPSIETSGVAPWERNPRCRPRMPRRGARCRQTRIRRGCQGGFRCYDQTWSNISHAFERRNGEGLKGEGAQSEDCTSVMVAAVGCQSRETGAAGSRYKGEGVSRVSEGVTGGGMKSASTTRADQARSGNTRVMSGRWSWEEVRYGLGA
jgi:hypothetical protein